jgi:hypothetical protein
MIYKMYITTYCEVGERYMYITELQDKFFSSRDKAELYFKSRYGEKIGYNYKAYYTLEEIKIE